jgi:hypothetical protein
VVADRAWRLRKAKALVKILALAADRRVHREQLAELLWPDRDAAAAANNLNQALYAARPALDGAGADGAAALTLIDGAVVLDARVDVMPSRLLRRARAPIAIRSPMSGRSAFTAVRCCPRTATSRGRMLGALR